MARILLIDTIYPDFLRTLPFDASSSYAAELRKVLDRKFGTFDAYSTNLRALGWTAIDIIANHEPLQDMWIRDYSFGRGDTLGAQMSFYDADVVFLQDLSIALPYKPRLLAAQCSCPWPGDEKIRQCDIVFSSFPHYVPRIEALGVKAIFLPLAFESDLLNRLPVGLERIHDVVFIGGVGAPSHWPEGMKTLEAVAAAIPTFKWWGYGYDTLPPGSALRKCYQGEAYGIDMYRILMQSKICLNRHGTVSAGFSNNLRMFEATGCGALLLTEDAPNLHQLFTDREVVEYESPEAAVEEIRHHMRDEMLRERVALKGQVRSLTSHTYAQRMKVVSETLQEMLCPA